MGRWFPLGRRRRTRWSAAALAACTAWALLPLAAASATPLPAGFTETAVLTDLELPTNVAFAPNGKVFVAEKRGVVKVFDGLDDPTGEIFADLRTNTHNWLDRGMTGLAVHPDFPATPHVYVTYTYDAPPGQTAPVWGSAGADFDDCVNDPGGYCLARGRLSRLVASGDRMSAEEVMLEGWCQPTYNHTINDVRFGPDGYLYVSGGDGAQASLTDYGQKDNPCGDPPSPAGTDLTVPTAQGGALRSQDLRTPGDPVGLNGTIIRIDAATGAAAPGNPLAGDADPNARRILASGLRNPFRFTFRPGTSEIWVGDVGWRTWEEIDRIPAPTSLPVDNFGWPCYEGANRQSGFDGLDLDVCEDLYAAGAAAVSTPYYSYRHAAQNVVGGSCPAGDQGSITGPAFYPGGSYPDQYDGAMFFADYARNCLLVMRAGPDGLPDRATLAEFSSLVSTPVDLETGPGGDLFYVDLVGGTVRRITFSAGNQAPVAVLDAAPTSGPAPLTVDFDAGRSRDPEGGALTYAWDLDGDGAFDDETVAAPSRTYAAGTTTVGLRVRDPQGATATATSVITAGESPPVPTITTPAEGTTWRVGQQLGFSGSAEQGGAPVPPSGLSWTIVMHHCPDPSSCHEHPLSGVDGVASGSFTAPDHEHYTFLELRLTATSSSGLSATTSRRLDPEVVQVTLESDPPGLTLGLNSEALAAPFTRPVILGSTNSVTAPSGQALGGTSYEFVSWSDGGPASHDVAISATTTLRATFRPTATGSTFDRAYNFGGPALTIDGRAWRSGTDPAVTHDGAAFSDTSVALSPPTDAARASMIRSSIYNSAGLDVAIASVPAATYDVYVTNWEDNRSVVFDLLLEGATVANDAVSGSAGQWRRMGPFRRTITDGVLNLATRGGTAANISGLELWRVEAAGAPRISVADASIVEGTSTTVKKQLKFVMTLSAASTSSVSVGWRTVPGTATAPADFTAKSGTVTFAAGVTSKTGYVPVVGDAVDEPDEQLSLELHSAVGASLPSAPAVGTITDDDGPAGGQPTISVGDKSVVEGDAGTKAMTFRITLSAPSTTEVRVTFATSDGTARAGSDYTARSGTRIFSPGQTVAYVSPPIIGDTLDEADEGLSLTLTAPVGATIADGVGVGTIVDDD